MGGRILEYEAKTIKDAASQAGVTEEAFLVQMQTFKG